MNAFAALLCGMALSAAPTEPQYEGRNLAYWLPRTQAPYSSEERAQAIGALGVLSRNWDGNDAVDKWAAEEIVPRLIALLDDPSPQIRRQAVIAICVNRNASTAAIPSLTRLLTDTDVAVRQIAAGALLFRGDKAESAIPALVESVQRDESPYVRAEAAKALRTAGPNGAAALEKLLNSPDAAVRRPAAAAFEGRYLGVVPSSTPPTLVPRLVELLDDEDAAIQISAARALVHMDPWPTETFPKLLTHRNAAVIDRTVFTLLIPAQTKPVPCQKELTAAVTADLALRKKYANLLGRLGMEVVPLLTELLDDSDAKVRSRAAEGLGGVGPAAESAVPSLKPLLTDMAVVHGDSQERVCHQVGRALSRILKDRRYMEGLPPLKPDGK